MQNDQLLHVRQCHSCKEIKPITEFGKDSSKKDKISYKCRTCIRKYHQMSTREQRRKWSRRNNEKIKARGGFSKYVMDYVDRYPHKRRAHRLLFEAIQRGDIERQPCEICGSFPTDGHHWNYNLPLVVVWLCKQHHRFIHGQTCTI